MTAPTFQQLATIFEGGPGFPPEPLPQRILTTLAILASGEFPDGSPVPPVTASAYLSLTGPGETATPAALTQQGGFTIDDNGEGVAINTSAGLTLFNNAASLGEGIVITAEGNDGMSVVGDSAQGISIVESQGPILIESNNASGITLEDTSAAGITIENLNGGGVGIQATGGTAGVGITTSGSLDVTVLAGGAGIVMVDGSNGGVLIEQQTGFGISLVAQAGGDVSITSVGSFGTINITSDGTGRVNISGNNGGGVQICENADSLGFFTNSLATQQTVTGSRITNPALANLLTALAAYGLIVDSTSP